MTFIVFLRFFFAQHLQQQQNALKTLMPMPSFWRIFLNFANE